MNLGPGTRVLVTGGTGLLGNNVVRALLDRGVPVRVLARQGSGCRALAGLDVEIRRGDIEDEAAVEDACTGCELVVHSAAMVHIGRRGLGRFERVNVGGTRHVLEAARRSGARLVHVSSADTVGVVSLDIPADESTPFDSSIRIPYMVTKRAAEDLVIDGARDGLDAVIVNPGFLVGPWDWRPSSGAMLLSVGRGLGWLAPRGYGSFVDVRDVTEALLAAAETGTPGRPYLLTGETLSYLDAWKLFADVTGRPPPHGDLGPVLSRLAGFAGDVGGWFAGRELPVNSGALGVSDRPRHYSSARAGAELGFRRRPLRSSVEDAWAWFREHGYA